MIGHLKFITALAEAAKNVNKLYCEFEHNKKLAETIKTKDMKQQIKAPDGYKYEIIDETTVQLVPIESKYPTKLSELDNSNAFGFNKNGATRNINNSEINGILKNSHDTEVEAIASRAMAKLRRLMNAWNKIDNGGEVWKIKDGETRCHITRGMYGIYVAAYCNLERPLMFKKQKTAQLFIETFKDLLETAKPLI